MLRRIPRTDLEPAGERTGLDLMIAGGLVGGACMLAAYFGFSVLDPAAGLEMRLTVLGLAAVYLVSGIVLIAHVRRDQGLVARDPVRPARLPRGQ